MSEESIEMNPDEVAGLRPNNIMLNDLSNGKYAKLRTRFRKRLAEICEQYLVITEENANPSPTNVRIARDLLNRLKADPFEELTLMIDYLSRITFDRKNRAGFMSSSGDEVHYLPNNIKILLETVDYKELSESLEVDRFDQLRARAYQAQGPTIEELQARISELEKDLARTQGELSGKDLHIQDLKEVKVDIQKVSQQNSEQALSIRSQMTDMQPILAALAQRLLSNDVAPSASSSLFTDSDLTLEFEKRIVVEKQLVSNPRLLLIRQLSVLHNQADDNNVSEACCQAVCKLITDKTGSMKGIILRAESEFEVKLKLTVPDVFDQLEKMEKAIQYVEVLIRKHYKNYKLADRIQQYVKAQFQQRVEDVLSPVKK